MAMVFGNLGETSGTGVGFTRDPRTGDRHFYAEFLANAQGEDIVAGIRTPEHIDDLRRRMPVIYDELLGIADRLRSEGTRLNSSHLVISYAVFCLKKKKNQYMRTS